MTALHIYIRDDQRQWLYDRKAAYQKSGVQISLAEIVREAIDLLMHVEINDGSSYG